jgi:hypothetical protein
MCTQWWVDDDKIAQFCALDRGHATECTTAVGWLFSETVEMV